MKRYLVIILFIIPICLIGQDTIKCSDFKYGKFTFPLTPDGSGYAIRQNNVQTSYVRDGEALLVWQILWKDECHYKMILKEIYDVSGFWSIGDVIDVEINSFKNNCYGYKADISVKNKDKFKGPTKIFDMMCKEGEF